MASPTLESMQPEQKKPTVARVPAERQRKRPFAFEPNFASAAGNMAIQRKATGPSANNAGAASILGSVNLDRGECSCGGACDECKKKQLIQRKGEGDNPIRLVDPAGMDPRSVQNDSNERGAPLAKLPTPIPYQLGADLPIDSSKVRGGMERRSETVAQLRAWAAALREGGSTTDPVESIIDRAVTIYEDQLRSSDAQMEANLGKLTGGFINSAAGNMARVSFDRRWGSWFGSEDKRVRGYSMGEQMISEFRTELRRAARLHGSDPGAQLFGVIARANRTIDPLGAWNATAAQALAFGLMTRLMVTPGVSTGPSFLEPTLEPTEPPGGPGAMNRRNYEASPKHGPVARGSSSAAPRHGQEALDASLQVKDTSLRRIGVDYESGEFVVFDRTSGETFHGHVRSWDELEPQMQKTLIDAGMANRRGDILIGSQ